MTLDQLTAAITDLARSVADIQSYLGIPPLQPTSLPLPQSVVASLPPVFPYEMPGYGTTMFSFQGVQATASVPIDQPRMLPSPLPSLQHPFTHGIFYKGTDI